ncbi:MAG: hypothetical protein ACYCZX_18380, partial [Rhodospirillaceae bacterium]
MKGSSIMGGPRPFSFADETALLTIDDTAADVVRTPAAEGRYLLKDSALRARVRTDRAGKRGR